jgi:hypothetical protein
MTYQTFALTRRELHLELAKWPAYERECETFWNEPTILEKTLPVLMSAALDVMIFFAESTKGLAPGGSDFSRSGVERRAEDS